jgi:hypothetical protein
MAANKLFAKVVVSALVVGNLGAYYFFWPVPNTNPLSSEASSGRASLKRDDASAAETLEPSRPAAEPVAAPEVPAPLPAAVKVAAAIQTAPDALDPPSAPVKLPDAGKDLLPPIPAIPATDEKTRLSSTALQGDPLLQRPAPDEQQRMLESLKQAQAPKPEPFAAPPSPLTLQPQGSAPLAAPPTVANSPWAITQLEITQGRTQLRARLHKSAEFKILCDRVEMKLPDGAVQAIGKVTLQGPGVTATCLRLTLPLGSELIHLEGQAEARVHSAPQPTSKEDGLTDGRPAWELKGEQLTLRPSGTMRGPGQVEVNPAPVQREALHSQGPRPDNSAPAAPIAPSELGRTAPLDPAGR